jgi:hypothetical protein
MRHIFKIGLIWCLPVWLFGAADSLKIEEAQLTQQGDSLLLHAQVNGLVDKKVRGTIQSGLPSVVEIELHIRDSAGKTLARGVLRRRIVFDVWEDRYTVEDGRKAQIFTGLEQAVFAAFAIRQYLPARWKSRQPMTVRLRAAISLISGDQSRKLAGWLNDGEQISSVTSEENSGSFSLDFGTVVSWFLKDKKRDEHWSEWHQLILSVHPGNP